MAATLALIITGWCAYEIRSLRAHPADPALRWGTQRLAAGGLAEQPISLEERVKQLEAAAPSPGLFMAAIQLHFAKLYFAAEARNWDLATFMRGEILENLDVVAALVPEERGVNIASLVDAFKNTPLAALKDAIEMKDRGMFREAYRDCIVMCNSSHQATGRPFITITVPTNSPTSNQQWEPPSASRP